MSDVSQSLDKIFSFVTSANRGFVLLVFLAIYPVYMWGVLSDLGAIGKSISYNTSLFTTAVGVIDIDRIYVGQDHCTGSACQEYLTKTVKNDIARDAYNTIPKHVILSLLGYAFIAFSACIWVAVLIGVKGNSKLILLSGLILSLPAALVVAGPTRNAENFCATPSVDTIVYAKYSSVPLPVTMRVCQRI